MKFSKYLLSSQQNLVESFTTFCACFGAPSRQAMKPEREVILLDSDGESDNHPPALGGQTTPSPDQVMQSSAVAPKPSGVSLEKLYEQCRQAVVECFPDISHEHVHHLYQVHISTVNSADPATVTSALIHAVLDGKTYPKRKRSSEPIDGEAKAAMWETSGQTGNMPLYKSMLWVS